MAKFKILKGQSVNLPSTKTEGQMYITTDQPAIYVDTDSNTRLKISSGNIQSRVEAIQQLLENMEVIDYVQENKDGSYTTAHLIGWVEYTPAPSPPVIEPLVTVGNVNVTVDPEQEIDVSDFECDYDREITEDCSITCTFEGLYVNYGGTTIYDGDVVFTDVPLDLSQETYSIGSIDFDEDYKLFMHISVDRRDRTSNIEFTNLSPFDEGIVSWNSLRVDADCGEA